MWTDKITEKGGMRRGRAGQRGKTQEYQGIAGLDGGTMGGCSHLSCPGRASSASTLFFHAQTGRNRRGTGRADESAEIPGRKSRLSGDLRMVHMEGPDGREVKGGRWMGRPKAPNYSLTEPGSKSKQKKCAHGVRRRADKREKMIKRGQINRKQKSFRRA